MFRKKILIMKFVTQKPKKKCGVLDQNTDLCTLSLRKEENYILSGHVAGHIKENNVKLGKFMCSCM